MKKYFLNKNNWKRILLIGLKYGAAVGAITIFIRFVFLSNADRIQGNVLATITAFVLLILGQYLAFRVFNKNHLNQELKFVPTLTVGLIFSLCLGIIVGITHYIEATYIDPEWSVKALEFAKQSWLANNYSQEAINSQIEWTTTFQTPSLWAIELTKFFMIISFGLALLVTSFMKVLEETKLV
jgi:hypothetical protein